MSGKCYKNEPYLPEETLFILKNNLLCQKARIMFENNLCIQWGCFRYVCINNRLNEVAELDLIVKCASTYENMNYSIKISFFCLVADALFRSETLRGN